MAEDSWEARMAARAREREQKRADDAIAPIEELLTQHDWLNGWPRTSRTQVLIGTGVHCIACGRCQGITCVAYPPDWDGGPPRPVWPFSEQDCPIESCRQWGSTYNGNGNAVWSVVGTKANWT